MVDNSDEPPLAGKDRDLVELIIKKGLGFLATQQIKLLVEIAEYADSHKVDVLNGSFGTGGPQAMTIIANLYKGLTGKDPEPETLVELTVHFLKALITEGEKIAKAAPDTLFVFASGNDGMNNDLIPSSPASVVADNVISVGASKEFDSIAEFSNFGKKSVHVLAPGVGIKSSIPGNEYLAASGTSQAAPYVAGVAAAVKKINPKLKPFEIKKILIETVDKNDDALKTTISGGIVNVKRAKAAARLSKTGRLSAAIKLSKTSISNMKSRFSLLRRAERASTGSSMLMPLPSAFKMKKDLRLNDFKRNVSIQKALKQFKTRSFSIR